MTTLTQALGERTADLQRLQAEYVNYKKRVDRDRDVARQRAWRQVVNDLLPVLDAIDAARQHEEVEGGFRSSSTRWRRCSASTAWSPTARSARSSTRTCTRP